MQHEQETDLKGEHGVSVQDSLSHHDSLTSVEAAHEDPKIKALTRRLIWKLDTRCVFHHMFFLLYTQRHAH